VPPECDPGHVYHLFVVCSSNRASLQQHLADSGIGTLIHYPVPIPRQPALATMATAFCPVADRVCSDVFSLPLHPSLHDDDLDAIVAAIHSWS
jgi:dTDP-4-amino-4,6-dideoxygalactose transaminase